VGGNHVGHDSLTHMDRKLLNALATAYGIDLNAVEICERISAWDADATRRRLYFSKSSPLNYSPWENQAQQTWFEFGPASAWPLHNREK